MIVSLRQQLIDMGYDTSKIHDVVQTDCKYIHDDVLSRTRSIFMRNFIRIYKSRQNILNVQPKPSKKNLI